jgi:hypothetical protein
MKRFFITTLLCAATLNAGLTKEALTSMGYQENWRQGRPDLSYPFVASFEQTHPLKIKGCHVPTQGLFPRGIKVYIPTADNSYEEVLYCGPDIQPDKKTLLPRLFWTTVLDKNNKKLYSVPTACLMIPKETLRTIAHNRRASAFNLTELTK